MRQNTSSAGGWFKCNVTIEVEKTYIYHERKLTMLFGKEIDPVCGMKVKKSKAAAVSEYKGKKYYFCALSCKQKFDQDPEKYLSDKVDKRHEMS